MAFEVTTEQAELAEFVGDLLDKRSQPRDSYDGGPPIDEALWTALVELGLPVMLLDESLGGGGAGAMDVTLVSEQLGRATAAVPFVPVAAAAAVLADLERQEIAPYAERLAGGERIGLALSATAGLQFGVHALRQDGGWTVDVSVDDLLSAAALTSVIVLADTDDGPTWFHIVLDDLGADGTTDDQPSLDPTQRARRLTAARAPSRRLGPAQPQTIERIEHLVMTLVAGEATGAAQRSLDLTAGHALSRHQFGEPIGKFQAVKHRMAEMLVQLENARSAAYNAAWAIDDRRQDQASAAHLAKAIATENAVAIVQDAIQLHGGIGFTWEHGLHLLLRRVKSCELVLGQPRDHFLTVADHILGDPVGPEVDQPIIEEAQ